MLSQYLRQQLNGKRLIFTITSGRSGTGYLAHSLSMIPGVASFHEPEPKFSDVMFKAQYDRNVGYKFWCNKKLPKIAQQFKSTYIETSHLFCKGFIEPLLDLDIVPDVIVLRRNCREVATSLFRVNAIPGRTTDGIRFLLSPDGPNMVPLPYWQILHDYQLCFWYCLEIEARMNKYKELFKEKNARVVEKT